MNNLKPLLKRVCAYSIDLLIVLTISSLISNTQIFKKQMNSYQKTYDEYKEKHNKYSEYLNLFQESYQDSEITEEEYNQLLEKDYQKELIISKYEDNQISKGESKEIIETLNKDFNNISKNYTYKLNKKGVFNSIITLSCTLIYFGIIQYLLNGQTIGKKILNLKIISTTNKKLNIINYILRSLIINNILLNTIGILFLILSSKKVYLEANNILSTLTSVFEATIIFLVLTRQDQRGLHDLLFNTEVISIKKLENDTKDTNKSKDKNTKVIEANYKEKTKNK